MSYFNHAYHKAFVATKADQAEAGTVGTPGGVAGVADGILTSTGVHVSNLKSVAASEGFLLGPGVTGFFDPKTNMSIDLAASTCPFYVASAALKMNDKQGPQHGGYQESNKSKVVNPKYINKAWVQAAGGASRAITEIGATADNFAGDANCSKDFLCGEDYNLRLDVKGHDVLRFANHNVYQTLQANGGCCADPSNPVAVDQSMIYLQWARAIVDNAYLKDYIRPIIQASTDGGTTFLSYAATQEIATEEGLPAGRTFNDLEALVAGGTPTTQVGMILFGAYVETKFGNCTFQPNDYYSVEPIQIFASEVDLNGDPCIFEGLCVVRTCEGLQAQGLGESVAREVILSESYLTNYFHSDLRIREITQGTDLWNVIDRNARYDRVYLQHSVPRFNNPSSTFDNDQYVLEIITSEGSGAAIAATLDAYFDAAVTTCEDVEQFGTSTCDLATALA